MFLTMKNIAMNKHKCNVIILVYLSTRTIIFTITSKETGMKTSISSKSLSQIGAEKITFPPKRG